MTQVNNRLHSRVEARWLGSDCHDRLRSCLGKGSCTALLVDWVRRKGLFELPYHASLCAARFILCMLNSLLPAACDRLTTASPWQAAIAKPIVVDAKIAMV